MGGTKGLLGLVIGLGVLILAGFSVVVATLAHRMFSPAPVSITSASSTLGEPAGTKVGALVAVGDRLGVLLQGGGTEDRVVLIDPRDGSRVATIAIAGPVRDAPAIPVR
jgi:hypothetical protein